MTTSQEIQNKIHDICLRLRANSIGSSHLKSVSDEKEINDNLAYYEEMLLSLFTSFVEKREKEVRLETINAFETHLKMGLQTMSVSKDPDKVSMSFAALFKYIETLKEMASTEPKTETIKLEEEHQK